MSDLRAELYQAFDSDPAPIVAFLTWLASVCDLELPIRLLDTGCGPGRLLRPLSDAGWSVTGMEPDASFLAAAREAVEDVGIEVNAGGFNEIEARDAFDMIVGINGSFAYLLTAAERRDALRRCYRALAPDGILFLDVPDFLRILLDYRGPGEFDAELDGCAVHLTRRHEIDFHNAVFTTREEYIMRCPGEPDTRITAEHAMAILAYPVLAGDLVDAGFTELRTFTSFRARAEERIGTGRLMVAARRGTGSV